MRAPRRAWAAFALVLAAAGARAARDDWGWLEPLGVELGHSVSFSQSEGLFATRRIPAHTVAATIPVSAILQEASITSEHPKYSRLVGILGEAKLDAPIRFAVMLLFERDVVGETSKWHHFISSLPSIGSTVFWNQEEFQALKGTVAFAATQKRLAKIREAHAKLRPLLVGDSPDESVEPIFKEFSIDSLAWSLTQVFGSGIFGQNSAGEVVGFIVPVVAHMSRSIQNETFYSVEEIGGATRSSNRIRLVLRTNREYSAGEVISFYVGNLSNADLILNHGTFVANNPNDVIFIPTALPKSDAYYQVKKDMLQIVGTETETVHILGNGGTGDPGADLLRLLRIYHLASTDFESASKVLTGYEPISLRNELDVLRAIVSIADRRSSEYGNATYQADLNLLEKLNREIDMDGAPLSRLQASAYMRASEKMLFMQMKLWVTRYWADLLFENSHLATTTR